jgi:hypothetical protein
VSENAPEGNGNGDRLDSWKAIAAYLNRDQRTVRRWEQHGLPVRRVPGNRGRGQSVFAFKSEIDAWLTQADEAPTEVPPPSSEQPPQPPRPAARRVPQPALVGGAVALIVATIAVVLVRGWMAPPEVMTIDLSSQGVVGRSATGEEVWRYPFPADRQHVIQAFGRRTALVRGSRPSAYGLVAYTESNSDHRAASGELLEFSTTGELRRRFAFDDRLRVGGKLFEPPWAVTTLAVDDSSGVRRIALASHHYTWYPSPVTILDERWQRVGTFVHAGWVEALEWLAPDRLLIGGFSESNNGGMVALLDPARVNGQGPEAPGSRYDCDECGPDRPVRMAVMPRSEVNLASGWRFNRAVIVRSGDRIQARTIELEMEAGHAEAIYEFSPSLALLGASFSDRYWDAHRMLEAEGKLDHTREQCPDRNGPRTVLTWTAATGWTTAAVTPRAAS